MRQMIESLAAPQIEATQRDYEQRPARKHADIGQRESTLRQQDESFSKAAESLEANRASAGSLCSLRVASDSAAAARRSGSPLQKVPRSVSPMAGAVLNSSLVTSLPNSFFTVSLPPVKAAA
jgi:hypothetical protein